MRANKKKPENPVQKTVENLGAVPADQFPEITEEQQQIIPRLKRSRLSNQPEYLRYYRA